MEDILFNKNPLKQNNNKKKGMKRKSQVDLLWQLNAWLDLWHIFIFIVEIWPHRFPISLATESMIKLQKYSNHQ